ncbi:MFS monosaccharide transporter [Salix suchowensis]|nr:MFS monosaccharide transporter [Salix suchowensis]
MAGGPAATGQGLGANAPKRLWLNNDIVEQIRRYPDDCIRCFRVGVMLKRCSLGGILFGYDTGVISGVKEMKDWLRTFGHPTLDRNGVCNLLVYGIIGRVHPLCWYFLWRSTSCTDSREGSIVLTTVQGIVSACLVFSVGVAMQTAATAIPSSLVLVSTCSEHLADSIAMQVVGRVFAASALVSSPKWIRGAVVSMYQWAITIGLLLASVINNATQFRDNHSAYQIPIAIQFVWALILAGGMSYLPESPRWLIKRGRDADAARSLARLTSLSPSDPVVENELDEIRANLEAERALGESSYVDCFRMGNNKIALRTLTGIFIQAWQQLTGINFIFYYGTTFFQNSGIRSPFLISIATNIVNVFMTLPGMWGVERFGRRRLLLVGAIGMCFCEYIVAIVGVTTPVSNLASQRVLIASCASTSPSSLPPGVPLPGLSLVKSSRFKYVPRLCHCQSVSDTHVHE